jgi:hypothetical protein
MPERSMSVWLGVKYLPTYTQQGHRHRGHQDVDRQALWQQQQQQ